MKNNGRTASEQESWDALIEGIQAIISGKLKVKGDVYAHSPLNIGTDKTFTGDNAFRAMIFAIIKGDNRFIGFKEAMKRGWNCKGAKMVHFIRPILKKDDDDTNNQNKPKARPFFRSYPLFNLADIEHDADDWIDSEQSVNAKETFYALLEKLETQVKVTRNTGTAHVKISSLEINIPPESAFTDYETMISVLLHEVGHHVGRDTQTFQEYTKYRGIEEMIAETTALFSSLKLGIGYKSSNANYVASWLKKAQETHPNALDVAYKEATRRTQLVVDMLEINGLSNKLAA